MIQKVGSPLKIKESARHNNVEDGELSAEKQGAEESNIHTKGDISPGSYDKHGNQDIDKFSKFHKVKGDKTEKAISQAGHKKKSSTAMLSSGNKKSE